MNRTARSLPNWASLLLIGWSIVIIVLFLGQMRRFLGTSLDTAATVGLGGLTVYIAWLTGFRIWRACKGPEVPAPLEASLYEVGLGALALVAAVFCMGCVQLYTPVAAYSLLAVLLLAPHRRFWSHQRSRWGSGDGTGSRRLTERRTEPRFALLLLGVVSALTLIHSLTPPTSQDALVYHLSIPAKYLSAGGFYNIEGNFFAHFPHNVEMLFILGLLLKGAELAKLYHWCFGVWAALTAAALTHRLSRRGSGRLAATLFATIPTTALIAGWAYVDLAVVFFTLLSVIAFVRFWQNNRDSWLIVAATFAGAAAGCKYTAGLQGLVLIAGVVVLAGLTRKSIRWALSRGAFVCGIVALLAGPWWLKSYLYTGNPIYPFAFQFFGGEGWDAERSAVLSLAMQEWGGARDLVSTLLLPWRLTMEADFFSQANFDGVIGCAFLIGAPLLLAGAILSPRHRLVLAIAVVHFAVWAVLTRQIRFLLPCLCMLSAVMAATLSCWPSQNRVRRSVAAALLCASTFNVLMMAANFAAHRPLGVVLGLESRDSYLQREIPGGDFATFTYINSHLPVDSYILFASLGNPGFLCDRKYYSDAFFENHTLKQILARSDTPDDAYLDLRQRGFTHVLFRFDCVLDPSGRKSDIPIHDQEEFANLLNEYAQLLHTSSGTYLYQLHFEP